MFITSTELQKFIQEEQSVYPERQLRSRKYKKNERRYQRRQKQSARDKFYHV